MAGLSHPRRAKNLLVVAFVVAVVNLPVLHATWTHWRVQQAGVDVVSVVTDQRNLGTQAEPSWWINYTLPADVDPERRTWSAEVDRATYEALDGEIGARVLPDKPAASTVDGEVRRRAGLWTTLAADAVLVLLIALWWRTRRRAPRADVTEVVAVADVGPGRTGGEWEDLGDGTAVVVGELVEGDDDHVLLDLGDRLVRVHLSGHTNPVGPRQQVRVRVRLG